MITTQIQPMEIRPLFIDFNAYTDGDDEFKQELIESMVENLQELATSLQQANVEVYQKVCHKVKSTLVMLEDAELQLLVDGVKSTYSDTNRKSALESICGAIINSLKKA
jgi:hypothetical protein